MLATNDELLSVKVQECCNELTTFYLTGGVKLCQYYFSLRRTGLSNCYNLVTVWWKVGRNRALLQKKIWSWIWRKPWNSCKKSIWGPSQTRSCLEPFGYLLRRSSYNQKWWNTELRASWYVFVSRRTIFLILRITYFVTQQTKRNRD